MKRIAIMILLLAAPAFAGWTEPARISEPGGCLYPQILAQGDTLHVVYTNASGGYYADYLRSTDAGNTWSEPVILCDTNETEVAMYVRILRHRLAIMAVWHSISNDVRRFNLGYAISRNDGEAWESPQLIIPDNWDRMGHFSAQGSDSIISIVVSRWMTPDLVFLSLRSTNFGESWSEPAELFRAYQSDLTDGAAQDSIFHFVWAGRFESGLPWEVYYMRSTDWGLTWSENILMSEADEYQSYGVSIYADRNDRVQLAWTDFKDSPFWWTGDIFLRQSYDAGLSWNAESQVTYHHRVLSSDIVSNNDTLDVVWHDERAENGAPSIYHISSTNGGSTWDEEYRLDPDEYESRNPALATSNGRVYVIWADDRSYPSGGIYPGIYFRRYEEGTSIGEGPSALPQKVSLRAYPNPFNSSTTISYANLPSGAIAIYNIAGQKVASLPAKCRNRQGDFDLQNSLGEVIWDGTDAAGSAVSSGIYFVRAGGAAGSQTIKLVYLK